MTARTMKFGKHLRNQRQQQQPVPLVRWRLWYGLFAGLLFVASVIFMLSSIRTGLLASFLAPDPSVPRFLQYTLLLPFAAIVCVGLIGAWCGVQLWRTRSGSGREVGAGSGPDGGDPTGYPFQLGKWQRYGARREPTRRDYWHGLAVAASLSLIMLSLLVSFTWQGPLPGEQAYMRALRVATPAAVAVLAVGLGIWNTIQLWRTRADA